MNVIVKSPILFRNKLETLLYLKDKLCASKILELYYFSVSDYRKDPDNILSKIATTFSDEHGNQFSKKHFHN